MVSNESRPVQHNPAKNAMYNFHLPVPIKYNFDTKPVFWFKTNILMGI